MFNPASRFERVVGILPLNLIAEKRVHCYAKLVFADVVNDYFNFGCLSCTSDSFSGMCVCPVTAGFPPSIENAIGMASPYLRTVLRKRVCFC